MFPPWAGICNKYDAICSKLPQQYPTLELRAQKEESIFWEQTAFELVLQLLLHCGIPFNTSADNVQKVVTSNDGVEFGVTSFIDSPKDLAKDVEEAAIDIFDLKYPGGVISPVAQITSQRPHHIYLNRRLAVRVAKEGKHQLDSDYVYIAFPKAARGFGGGLDGISKNFSFSASDYTYQPNGITGIVIVGEYIDIQPKNSPIEHGVWLVKALAFPHASNHVKELLSTINNVTIEATAFSRA